MLGVVKELATDAKCFIRIGESMAFYQGGPVGVRLSYLAATAILVIFIVSVGANVVNVNAGRPHPLQTGGPGNCVEGQKSVEQWCPGQEYKEGGWKSAMVCINGHLVHQTQDCPTETHTETQTQTDQCRKQGVGTLVLVPNKDVTYCKKDPTQPATWKECVDGAWKQVDRSWACPDCKAGDLLVLVECPNDKTKWHVANVCIDGKLVRQEMDCAACKPDTEGGCIEKCDPSTDKCKQKWWCNSAGSWEPGEVKSCCYIATAAFGSELSPEVQLLRNFRDRDVLQTYAGGEGMKVFNLIYYSFSPQVAQTISSNENLRTVMRYVLYPLIGILWGSQQLYAALAFSPEGAIVVAGVFTGSMIGLLYALPFYGVSLAVSRAFRRKLTFKHVSLLLVLLATASTLIVVSEVTRFGLLMQLSTSLLALTSAALPGVTLSVWALSRHQ